jgi:hypothetical protein
MRPPQLSIYDEAHMHEEILEKYFTDPQLAAIIGISLGGLRNKLSRSKPASETLRADLPQPTQAASRLRLWNKDTVREWLLVRFNGDVGTVELLMRRGEATDSGATRKKAADAASDAHASR